MGADKTLDTLRKEIDDVDAALHDLLVRRTEIVEDMSGLKKDGGVNLRPGREANILRNLVGNHYGNFPKQVLVRIWREIFGALVSLQGPFSVAVYAPDEAREYWDLARDQYGSHAPITACQTALRVIDAVMRGDATVGVLPLPRVDDSEPWWPHMVSEEKKAPRVIARLPFAGPSNGRAGDLEGLVISQLAQEETGHDRSFMAIDTEEEIPYSRLGPALTQAGLIPTFTASWSDPETRGTWLYLAEIDDFVTAEDRRIERFQEILGRPGMRTVNLGGYAVPLDDQELAIRPALKRKAASGRSAARAKGRRFP